MISFEETERLEGYHLPMKTSTVTRTLDVARMQTLTVSFAVSRFVESSNTTRIC